jgi:hypothetical protein
MTETNVKCLLAIAQFYGSFRLLNFDGVYQDNEIEDLVELKVTQSSEFILPSMSQTNTDTVLIASKLASFGGHSRVVLNWLTAFKKEGSHKLLISQIISQAVRLRLDNENISFHLCTNQGIDLVNEIMAYCAHAKRVVLHIDPDDIVAATAARIMARSGKQVIFYNHADHRFSFGTLSANLVCEVSDYGIELNRRARRLQDSCYLGIPIVFHRHENRDAAALQNRAAKTVLSGGDSYKYAPGTVFFGSFIDDLLEQRSDVSILLVGPTGNEPWWLGVRERWHDRVRFIDHISHHEYLDIVQRADVYVDSFPITGGTAFPEALLNGKPVAGLHGPFEGYSPADELRAKDVHTLTRQVINLLDLDPQSLHRVEAIREKAAAIHSIANFRERVRNMYSGICDRNSGHKVDVDTRWIEKRWARDEELFLPGRIMPPMVPLKFGLSFKLRANRLLGRLSKKYRGYILLGIIFRFLPAGANKFAKDMRIKLRIA